MPKENDGVLVITANGCRRNFSSISFGVIWSGNDYGHMTETSAFVTVYIDGNLSKYHFPGTYNLDCSSGRDRINSFKRVRDEMKRIFLNLLKNKKEEIDLQDCFNKALKKEGCDLIEDGYYRRPSSTGVRGRRRSWTGNWI